MFLLALTCLLDKSDPASLESIWLPLCSDSNAIACVLAIEYFEILIELLVSERGIVGKYRVASVGGDKERDLRNAFA